MDFPSTIHVPEFSYTRDFLILVRTKAGMKASLLQANVARRKSNFFPFRRWNDY
ncbi:Hypothetical predicted protein [Olea europaea subsp. europaea]|uniref:Uncharacterized protein n=1 Tax=Olea europaea subsp. europaea TaxID=158383 RepID=A0A8S0R518_OLEEU|nr:Hypothetical predicted protein [Olea europaea subsp. europaea]